MTKKFPFAKSTLTDPLEASLEVGEALSNFSIKGGFGIVYVSSFFAENLNVILESLKEKTGISAWSGGVGLGIIANAFEVFDQPAIAAMIFDIPENSFQILGSISTKEEFETSKAQACSFASPQGAALCIIHIDPSGDPSGHGLTSFPAELSSAADLFLVGGLTSGRNAMPAIDSGGAAAGAATGVLVALDQNISTGVSQGCTPIGPVRLAKTAGVGVLSHLGEESAVGALIKDLGLSEQAGPNELRAALNGLHIAFPIKGADRQDYLVRNITGIDLAKGLIGVAEAAEDGAAVFFCRRDKKTASNDLKEMANNAAKRLKTAARGAIYISCLARGPNLFGPNNEEIAIVKDAIGDDVPVLGFFANGEIAHNRLYGYTGVLVIFG